MQANFVNKDVLTSLQEEIRRAKQEVADLAYELQNTRDSVTKVEKTVEANRDKAEQAAAKNHAFCEDNDRAIKQLQKQMQLLDEKLKGVSKAAAMSGNPAMAGSLLQDLEE